MHRRRRFRRTTWTRTCKPSRLDGTCTPSSASWSSSGRSRRSSTTPPSACCCSCSAPAQERGLVPGRLVHRVAVHPDPGGAGHPNPRVAVLAEPAEQAAGSGYRGGAGRGGDHHAEPARARAALVRRAAVAVLAAAGRPGGRLPDPHRDRQRIFDGREARRPEAIARQKARTFRRPSAASQ